MGSIKTYKPRHLRTGTNASFHPRKFDPTGDADRKLHESDKWRNFSIRFREVNPECYVCGGKSEVTDHVEPSKGRREAFERTANHIALCSVCHNTVTAKFDMKWRPGESTTPKITWLNEERARNEILQDRKFSRPKVLKYREV